MKRILSAVAVVAIVSGALAFAPAKKGGTFCAAFTLNGSCTLVNGKTEIDNGKSHATYFKYNAWDGQASNCITGRCETQVELYNEQ